MSKAINAFVTLGVIATFAAAGVAIGGKAAQAETGGTVEEAGCWPEPQTEITQSEAEREAVIIQVATCAEPQAVIMQSSLLKDFEKLTKHIFMVEGAKWCTRDCAKVYKRLFPLDSKVDKHWHTYSRLPGSSLGRLERSWGPRMRRID